MVHTIARGVFLIICVMSILYSHLSIADENCLLDSCTTKDSTPIEMNVFNKVLQPCSSEPMTGFYRDSFCRTGKDDRGVHVVCAEMTSTFLEYTKSKGNDLSSPAPQYGFPGLNPGDQWCLCATRWTAAEKVGIAPPVVLKSTSTVALQTIPIALILKESKQQ